MHQKRHFEGLGYIEFHNPLRHASSASDSSPRDSGVARLCSSCDNSGMQTSIVVTRMAEGNCSVLSLSSRWLLWIRYEERFQG